MIDEEAVIFYFIKKIIHSWPKEQREKLKKLDIVVRKDAIRFGSKKPREMLGCYNKNKRRIDFYVPTIKVESWKDRDIYKVLKGIESLVEHELYHAIGGRKK